MSSFSTLHIFGYGETQLIGDKFNKKVKSSQLTTLQAVIDNVWSKKPVDSDASQTYHAINIFHNMFADWQPNSGKGYRTPYAQLSALEIDALVNEINTLVPTSTTTTTTVAP
jgi:hypothetical protein